MIIIIKTDSSELKYLVFLTIQFVYAYAHCKKFKEDYLPGTKVINRTRFRLWTVGWPEKSIPVYNPRNALVIIGYTKWDG